MGYPVYHTYNRKARKFKVSLRTSRRRSIASNNNNETLSYHDLRDRSLASLSDREFAYVINVLLKAKPERGAETW